MEYQIKLVVFDMAGTTVNENNIVYKTLHKAINAAGFNFTLEQVLEYGAGKEKLQAVKEVLLQCANLTDDALAQKIFQNFLPQLEQAYIQETLLPQNNANEIFAFLRQKNIYVALNTGYDRKTAESILKKLGWQVGKDIDCLVTASDVSKNRPEPDMIYHAMKQLDIVDSNQVVKVGDSAIDIQEGQHADCALSIGITTGAHTEAQLQTADPDYIIHDLIELKAILD